MSERKTDEIKFRVTPTEKAAWQEYAKSAQLGLSELIRREVNEGIRQNETKQAVELAVEQWAANGGEIPLRPMHAYPKTAEEALAAPQEESSDETSDISKEDADRLVAEGKASWMYEARNG